jgi:glycosyltransferase involved in cell wall biosynthesis
LLPIKSICVIVQNRYENDIRVRRKAEALVAAGYSVDALALHSPGREKAYTLGGVNVRTVSLSKKRGSLARYGFEYIAFFLWALVRVTVQMRHRRYAVIDINTLPDFLVFAALFARWMRAKVVLDMHEITPEFYISKYGIAENSWAVRFLKYVEKISFNFADHVITINEPILDLLVGRELDRGKSTVITNSVDERRLASVSESSAPAVAPETFVMMYHGTLTGLYGLDIAIEAFALVHEEMPGAEFWILGDGSEIDALTKLAGQRGLASKVKLVGVVPGAEIQAWLSRCDVGILALRRDIFLDFASPNKLPEYIVMDKPVIMSRLKAIRHYFSEDALAYCEPNDPADLAKQMVRVYRDRALRARLAARAKQEYAPICWDVMKQRYLRVIEDMVDPAHRTIESAPVAEPMDEPSSRLMESLTKQTITDNGDAADSAAATLKLLAYCKANDWAGYDPYDALNSEVFKAVPLLDSRLPRLVLTQVLKRSPINVRRLLRVPKTQNAKAMALFLSAFLKLEKTELADQRDIAGMMIDRLVALRSPGAPYWCWGYSFPWQTRTIVVPGATPNLVCTTFVATALLDAYEQRGDSNCLSMAVSGAEYILNELYWEDSDSGCGFSYPLPGFQTQTHNANFLAAALFCRVWRHTGEEKFLDTAMRVARYSATRQHADGSWYYGEWPSQRWIDNFHTGYNLCALEDICRDAGTTEFESCIRQGLDFYRAHFFREDGAPKYFHNHTYPIDIHCVAQSIITLLSFRDLDPDNVRLAHSVFQWAMSHMWDKRGFFYYRVLRLATIRTSYMRWSQAWMLRALADLASHCHEPIKYQQVQETGRRVTA